MLLVRSSRQKHNAWCKPDRSNSFFPLIRQWLFLAILLAGVNASAQKKLFLADVYHGNYTEIENGNPLQITVAPGFQPKTGVFAGAVSNRSFVMTISGIDELINTDQVTSYTVPVKRTLAGKIVKRGVAYGLYFYGGLLLLASPAIGSDIGIGGGVATAATSVVFMLGGRALIKSSRAKDSDRYYPVDGRHYAFVIR